MPLKLCVGRAHHRHYEGEFKSWYLGGDQGDRGIVFKPYVEVGEEARQGTKVFGKECDN